LTSESSSLRRDAPRRVQLELAFAPPAPEKQPGRDAALEALARTLLIQQGATALAAKVRVEWSARLRSAAGRAEFANPRVLLNCRLPAHGEAEIDRTLRHELAHLLAIARAGRRRIAPHGPEWRRACADLGIADEMRCHNLPFPIRRLQRRYLYSCPHCRRDFPRTRPLRRTSACLACCRAHNRGRYDARFKLRIVRR
jgi:predicted SprT family Zn-dependent metalloprotease